MASNTTPKIISESLWETPRIEPSTWKENDKKEAASTASSLRLFCNDHYAYLINLTSIPMGPLIQV